MQYHVNHASFNLSERGSFMKQEYLQEVGRTEEDFQEEVLAAVMKFCGEHRERVRNCLVDIYVDGVVVSVIQQHPGFDSDLEDAVTALDLSLVDWNVTAVGVPPISNEAASHFANVIHGELHDGNVRDDGHDEVVRTSKDENDDHLWGMQDRLGE